MLRTPFGSAAKAVMPFLKPFEHRSTSDPGQIGERPFPVISSQSALGGLRFYRANKPGKGIKAQHSPARFNSLLCANWAPLLSTTITMNSLGCA